MTHFTRIDKHKFGPWAIVTGASSGIGEEFARQLAASGINVVLVARRLHLLEALGKQLKQEYRVDYRTIGVDLANENFLKKINATAGDLDIGLIVSNAGYTFYGTFLSTDATSLQQNFHLNVTAHLKLIHHYGQKLAERGRGGVILVSSIAGFQGVPYMANYAACKAYVLSLGEGLNIEFKEHGVNVSVLLPGPTDTASLTNSGTDPSDMPMKPMSAAQCVAEGLAALQVNRVAYMPGRLNRLMINLIPRSIRPKMLGGMIKKGLDRLTEQAAATT